MSDATVTQEQAQPVVAPSKRQVETMAGELAAAFEGNTVKVDTLAKQLEQLNSLGLKEAAEAVEATIGKLRMDDATDRRKRIVEAIREQVNPATMGYDVAVFASDLHANGGTFLLDLARWLESDRVARVIREHPDYAMAKRAIQALSLPIIDPVERDGTKPEGGLVVVTLPGEKRRRGPSTGGGNTGGTRRGKLAIVDTAKAAKINERDNMGNPGITYEALRELVGQEFESANKASIAIKHPARKEDGGPNISGREMLSRYGLVLNGEDHSDHQEPTA